MEVKIYSADSLDKYVRIISDLKTGDEEAGVLWFRGISDWHYALIPSLYRKKELFDFDSNIKKKYTAIHYAEDVRTQHYIAKNYHFHDKLPASRVEWLEVMQHHRVMTRVLDWSESSIHALLFAVEPFIDGEKYTAEDRKHQNPCVWVLQPQKLNQNIFRHLMNGRSQNFLKNEVCSDLEVTDGEWADIWRQVKLFRTMYDNAGHWQCMKHLNGIVNLSAINDEVLRDRSRLKVLLCRGEILPVFYFLSRIYSDGLLIENRKLPPLSVIQPYHSERIKAQKGVFSVFPVYHEKQSDCILREAGLDPNGMQNMPMSVQCLIRIDLSNPGRIARDLLQNGIRDSWLYPENPIIANEIENTGVR